MELPLSVLCQLTTILEHVGIRYVLVGSFASSIHGMYRSTADIDILLDIKAEQVRELFEALKDAFYIDELAIREAVDKQRSFNAIHFDSVFKVDFFVAKSDAFTAAQLDRRELRKITPERYEQVYVATAEDTILAKLKWFRAGNEISMTQWNDVLGILGTSGSTVDFEYLHAWAEKLDLTDLLQRALRDVAEDAER